VVFQDRIRGRSGYCYGLTVATGSNMGRLVTQPRVGRPVSQPSTRLIFSTVIKDTEQCKEHNKTEKCCATLPSNECTRKQANRHVRTVQQQKEYHVSVDYILASVWWWGKKPSKEEEGMEAEEGRGRVRRCVATRERIFERTENATASYVSQEVE
jgi:hypothetical protein